MKKLVVVIVLGICLSLALYSSAFCAPGGGHAGGGHFSGGGRFGGSHFHGGHFHHFGGPRVFIGGYFGFPYYYPYWAYPSYYPRPYYYPYYDPYPYYPYADAEPPVYGESQQDYYWYYCKDPQGYYPYVTSCPGGWMSVVPTPPRPGEEDMIK